MTSSGAAGMLRAPEIWEGVEPTYLQVRGRNPAGYDLRCSSSMLGWDLLLGRVGQEHPLSGCGGSPRRPVCAPHGGAGPTHSRAAVDSRNAARCREIVSDGAGARSLCRCNVLPGDRDGRSREAMSGCSGMAPWRPDTGGSAQCTGEQVSRSSARASSPRYRRYRQPCSRLGRQAPPAQPVWRH